MITKKHAHDLWHCHNEIEKAEKLKADMLEALYKYNSLELKNAFGERQGLQLGIPMSESSQRLLNVSPKIALQILEQYIIEQKELLTLLNQSVLNEATKI